MKGRGSRAALLFATLAITGCGAVQTRPAVEIRTVEVVKETQRPCPVSIPPRPTPLARPLPSDSVALAALLGAKLVEIMGPGGTIDRYEAALRICTKP